MAKSLSEWIPCRKIRPPCLHPWLFGIGHGRSELRTLLLEQASQTQTSLRRNRCLEFSRKRFKDAKTPFGRQTESRWEILARISDFFIDFLLIQMLWKLELISWKRNSRVSLEKSWKLWHSRTIDCSPLTCVTTSMEKHNLIFTKKAQNLVIGPLRLLVKICRSFATNFGSQSACSKLGN